MQLTRHTVFFSAATVKLQQTTQRCSTLYSRTISRERDIDDKRRSMLELGSGSLKLEGRGSWWRKIRCHVASQVSRRVSYSAGLQRRKPVNLKRYKYKRLVKRLRISLLVEDRKRKQSRIRDGLGNHIASHTWVYFRLKHYFVCGLYCYTFDRRLSKCSTSEVQPMRSLSYKRNHDHWSHANIFFTALTSTSSVFRHRLKIVPFSQY